MRRPAGPRPEDPAAEIASLADLLREVVGKAPGEAAVWPIYARTEKQVARLKFRLGTERPGVFSELPKSKRPEEFLTRALESLGTAQAEIRAGDEAGGLEALRTARTCLRAYLAELGRVRSREKRRVALSRRSSSQPASSPSS
ncbi:MAG: hypothetical protein ABSA72_08420 [Nitrososphaerales archaeon]|jgi:hypothetical protein